MKRLVLALALCSGCSELDLDAAIELGTRGRLMPDIATFPSSVPLQFTHVQDELRKEGWAWSTSLRDGMSWTNPVTKSIHWRADIWDLESAELTATLVHEWTHTKQDLDGYILDRTARLGHEIEASRAVMWAWALAGQKNTAREAAEYELENIKYAVGDDLLTAADCDVLVMVLEEAHAEAWARSR